MLHENTLSKRFYINDTPQKWVSLETRNREYLPGFQTNRIAKVYDGERLYFTIGETLEGKRHGLSDAIAKIIDGFGLDVIDVDSTSGRPSVFVGFHLADCSPKDLEGILQEVEQAIAACR